MMYTFNFEHGVLCTILHYTHVYCRVYVDAYNPEQLGASITQACNDIHQLRFKMYAY